MAVLHQNYVVLFTPVVATITIIIAAVVPSFGCSSSPPPPPLPPPSGLQYWVGDSLWTIPPFSDYYSNWSSTHFFKLGDSLVFDFETGRYNVIQVTRQEYESCTSWSPIKIYYGGPAIVSLTEPGVLYFICNLSNYCNLGQKIAIAVHNCPVTYPPSPAPAPVRPASPPSPARTTVRSPPSSPPPYNNGSHDEPFVPVPSPVVPSPTGEGRHSPENNGPRSEKSAAIMSGGKFGLGLCMMVLVCFSGYM